MPSESQVLRQHPFDKKSMIQAVDRLALPGIDAESIYSIEYLYVAD
jgi:hypothetical protein